MEITVLGCWAPYPRAGGACSGYLIRDGETAILLEAGNGSFSRLLEILDFRRLSAVIISHFHLDHCADLFCLRHAVKGARRDGSCAGPLLLFAPGEPRGDFESLAGDSEAFLTRPIENLPDEDGARVAVVGGLKLEFRPTRHSVPGYGVAVSGRNGRLVYSGDTAWFPELARLWTGARLLLCEASGLARDLGQIGEVHLTAHQAGELARESGASHLLLTHFWPEYDPLALQAEAAQACECPVMAVREGGTYSLTG
ncbi:MAG: MBL fold metallo-hydrolase [Candidatus Desulforudis sp.]|nr:MBL fold metallo-hydrolase [Desulforudis sp.]